MRYLILATVFRWLAVILILRVLVAIVANYPDYFPPNFDSLFLQGRERTFTPNYQFAFYAHIFSGPLVLLNGLILLSESLRQHRRKLHRVLGWIQVVVMLGVVLPTSIVMSQYAFGGWRAGLSFQVLSVATAFCVVVGVIHACGRRYPQHREWMIRTYLLLCSAVVLRLISGAAGLLGVTNPEDAYLVAAWCSWLVPLAIYEIVVRLPGHR